MFNHKIKLPAAHRNKPLQLLCMVKPSTMFCPPTLWHWKLLPRFNLGLLLVSSFLSRLCCPLDSILFGLGAFLRARKARRCNSRRHVFFNVRGKSRRKHKLHIIWVYESLTNFLLFKLIYANHPNHKVRGPPASIAPVG